MTDLPALAPFDPTPPPPPVAIARPQRDALPWWFALMQVFLVSGIPTQTVLLIPLLLMGVPLLDGDNISLELFATLSLLDTAFVALLIRLFLTLSKETSQSVFFGNRPVGREALLGVLLIPVVFGVVLAIVLGLREIAPWMHNVPKSPLEAYMRTPTDATIFVVVVILAGGVREELQRAFILHRFEQRLGGIWVGLTAFSLAFGLLHIDQGFDAAIAVGTLGLFWGLLYIKRRSAVMAMVNHAGFNAGQVLQVVLSRAFGM